MGILSVSQLTAMRAQIVRSFPQTAGLLRTTSVSNGAGGRTKTETQIASYPCRVESDRTGTETAQQMALTGVARYTLRLPFDADAKATDRLRVAGIDYEVISVFPGRGEAIALSCQCVKVGA